MPRRLLLLGGGPAHTRVLASFAREPLAGADLALLTPDPHLVQTALLPAFVAGRVGAEACRVDTAALAQAAGATWVRGRVVAFDAARRSVTLADGQTLDADLVSIDEPGALDRDALPGAREHALALHPAEPFVALFGGLVEMASRRELDIVVLGNGPEGVECALALAQRLSAPGTPPSRVALVQGGGDPLAGWPAEARAQAQRALGRARITVFREPAAALREGTVVLSSGARLACDAALLAAAPVPPAWLAGSGLACGAEGRPAVTPTLQGVAHAEVFAPGPAGLLAAEALAANLRRAVAAGPLQPTRVRPPGTRWLRLGRAGAVVAWGSVVMAGWAVGAWCARRDGLGAAPWPATRSAGS